MKENANTSMRAMLVAGLLAAAILFILIVVGTDRGRPYLFRDPTQPSANDLYTRLMDESLLVEPGYEGVVGSVVLSTNAGGIDLVMPAYHALHDHVDNALFDYHRIAPGGSYESGAGRIWIDHIAVAHGEFPVDRETGNSQSMPARFFDPDLREWTESETALRLPSGWDSKLDFHGAYPAVQFLVNSELREEAKLLAIHAFDARTHHPIDRNFFHQGSIERGLRVEGDVGMWHQGPVELLIDVAFGPPEIIEFDAKAGNGARYSGGELTLLVKADGMKNHSTLTLGTEAEVSLPAETDPGKGTTCLLFASLPKAVAWPLYIECLNADGRALPNAGSAAFDIFMRENIEANAGNVRTVRARYFPHRARLVFRLPEIPGLPEINHDIDNLMNVRIPYLKLDREYEFNGLIGRLTQMSMRGVGLSGGRFPSPRVFRNASVGELVDECARLHGPKFGVVIDQETPSIEFLDMSFRARLERLGTRIQSAFQ